MPFEKPGEPDVLSQLEALCQNFGVSMASEDPDLRAVLELRTFGFTDVVHPSRADHLEDYDPTVLQQELMRDYGLSEEEVQQAIRLASQRLSPSDMT